MRFISLFLFLFVSCSGDGERPSDEAFQLPPRPNVVLVVIDALRRDHLGLYGYDKPTSPFLDRLAREGLAVGDAHAQASQTFGSTSTLLTSRNFPLVTANENVERVLVVEEANLMLPEVLREAGYATFAAFTNPHHHPASGFFQGFDEARYLTSDGRPYGRGVDVHRSFYEWLDARQDSRPFFAYLHFMEVHNPYQPPRNVRRLFVEKKGTRLPSYGVPEEAPSAEDLAYTIALYDGEIRFVDGILEELVGELKARGLWQETLFVLTSDHGDEFLDHGAFGHGETLHSELVRIPMLLAGAGLADHPSPDRRFSGLVRNLDLAPTFAEIAGGEIPEGFEGTSLVPAIESVSPRAAEDAFSYARTLWLRSLTSERWHFVLDVRSREKWLFDRGTDPGGTFDVAPSHPAEMRRFSRRISQLEQKRREVDRLARQLAEGRDASEVDEDVVRQLKALGYLND